MTNLTVAEAAWKTGNEWNGAAEASGAWNDGGNVAGDAPGVGAKEEGGDSRTCRL